jgi:hypothetical protein
MSRSTPSPDIAWLDARVPLAVEGNNDIRLPGNQGAVPRWIGSVIVATTVAAVGTAVAEAAGGVTAIHGHARMC